MINTGTVTLYGVKIVKNVTQASKQLPPVKQMRTQSVRSAQRANTPGTVSVLPAAAVAKEKL